MFIRHKSELINLDHVVKIKKATSTGNKHAQSEFYKLILTLTTGGELTLDFDHESEIDQLLKKLNIIL